jgi:hypothetical protein
MSEAVPAANAGQFKRKTDNSNSPDLQNLRNAVDNINSRLLWCRSSLGDGGLVFVVVNLAAIVRCDEVSAMLFMELVLSQAETMRSKYGVEWSGQRRAMRTSICVHPPKPNTTSLLLDYSSDFVRAAWKAVTSKLLSDQESAKNRRVDTSDGDVPEDEVGSQTRREYSSRSGR